MFSHTENWYDQNIAGTLAHPLKSRTVTTSPTGNSQSRMRVDPYLHACTGSLQCMHRIVVVLASPEAQCVSTEYDKIEQSLCNTCEESFLHSFTPSINELHIVPVQVYS